MISRRQIIASGQPSAEQQQQQQQQATTKAPTSSSSSASSKPSNLSSSSSSSSNRLMQADKTDNRQQQQQHQVISSKSGKMAPSSGAPAASKSATNMTLINKSSSGDNQQQQQRQQQQQQQDSDDYALNSSTMSRQNAYEDYAQAVDERSWRRASAVVDQKQQVRANHQHHQHQHQYADANQDTGASSQVDAYGHFDPYEIDEEDVWYSEMRLFEDHLAEIYNKWPLLDDDIWCKLIIMERNRRIGKAYARVPIVTIDGSHELSYDGYKLALNGFDNPDRDEETEECRKRIGKGIRIKMDNFGNILIKRLSKSGVYVKEWINPASPVSGGSSNSTNGSSGAGVGRSMPSRQQLIKAASMGGNHHRMSSMMNSSGTPTSSASSGGSSMDSPNDSAICDEVMNIGGRLNLDKIYVMFDMKKFQANITQELCRAFPDRKKLEQQCFSIVGLTRDSEEILYLPCWVMVINIVAIEMLNERFPLSDHHHSGHGLADFPDTRRLNQQQAPSFVSIFDNPNSSGAPMRGKTGVNEQSGNKEEDPYSMPANASSSDVKSSINDYGTASAKNMSNYIESTTNHSSRFYGTAKSPYQAPPSSQRNGGDMLVPTSCQSELPMMRNRSKSHFNIYGPSANKSSSAVAASRYVERYNNSSSIYSPGHMLVPHSGDHSVPPKLPPRDFVAKRGKSKSSTNVNSFGDTSGQIDQMNSPNFDDPVENIYSTRDELNSGQNTQEAVKIVRKTRKNRFLESLKAPLELAKSSRSASAIGASTGTLPSATNKLDQNSESTKKASSKTKSSSGFGKAKNLRSFLGVGSKSSANTIKDSNSDDSNYVHVDCDNMSKLSKYPKNTKAMTSIDKVDADSAVDPNEDIDDSQQIITNSSASPVASYNDLDIPTPDYETDENIYALDDGSANNNINNNNKANKQKKNSNRARRYSTTNEEANIKSTKDDLYYSGFRAHVPHGLDHHAHGTANNGGAYMKSSSDRYNHNQAQHLNGNDRLSRISNSAAREPKSANNRYLIHTSRMLAAKMCGRDKIYGSTLGLHQQQSMTGSRYRSASMQRYYPSTMRSSAVHVSNSSACDYDYPSQHYSGRINRSHNEIAYDQDIENPYAMSAGLGPSTNSPILVDNVTGHYGATTASSCIGGASRRRSVSKMMPVQSRHVAPSLVGSTNHYDMGRSSSGIYGNNSSCSSSEYADWHPQVRKVNSSGYLNSIFKSHKLNSSVTTSSAMGVPTNATLATAQMHGPFSNNSSQVDPLSNNNNNIINNNNNNSNNNASNNKILMTGHGYHNSNNMNVNNGTAKKSSQVRNATRALKAKCDSALVQANVSKQQQEQVVSSALNDPAYRSYDSSNDSDPSYTNSSDGLDIYDHIGAQTRTTNHLRRQHNQFLDHNLAPEVHVGEWENMYDR